MDATKFNGIIVGGDSVGGGNFYDLAYYRKLGEGTNTSLDSNQTSTGGGSVPMSVDNSSVGSSDSHTGILRHNALRKSATGGSSVGHSFFRAGRVTHALSSDALAQVLMDPGFPAQGLDNYDEWTLDLRKLIMGEPFAQGAFGKLYSGTSNGEDSAIKLLEKPENDLESRTFGFDVYAFALENWGLKRCSAIDAAGLHFRSDAGASSTSLLLCAKSGRFFVFLASTDGGEERKSRLSSHLRFLRASMLLLR